MKPCFISLVLAVLSLPHVCVGTTFLELQSSYLGDGWFRYRVRTPNDPFFEAADLTQVVVSPFTNRVEVGAIPQDWTLSLWSTNSNYASWSYAQATPSQFRPYECEFLVRSSLHSHRVGTNSQFVVSLVLRSDYWRSLIDLGVISQNMVSAFQLPCIVPCSPEQADGSPPEYLSSFKAVEDILLDALIVTNDLAYGIKFTWSAISTVLLQGSTDSSHWTNIAYVYGNAGQTTWTTNQPLNEFGNLFRLQLVSMGEHTTNLPPLDAANSAALTSQAPLLTPVQARQAVVQVLSGVPQGDELLVKFVSLAGIQYLVTAMDLRGNILASQRVTGTGAEAEARFCPYRFPDVVWFKVETVL